MPEPRTQATRIAAKFGGVPALAKALDRLAGRTGNPRHRRDISAVYRWNLPKASGGSDGIVPTKSLEIVLLAARQEGIMLTADDTDPRAK